MTARAGLANRMTRHMPRQGSAAVNEACTGISGTEVSEVSTGKIDSTVPLTVSTRPAYTGPDPGSGVITTANGDRAGDPLGARSRTTAVCFALTAMTRAWPPAACCPAAVPSLVIWIRAAPRGADRTRVDA